jgi:hypothetical protein
MSENLDSPKYKFNPIERQTPSSLMSELDPTKTRQILSPGNFPTPRIALRRNLTLADVEWFAVEQANVANIAVGDMNDALASTPKAHWPEVFANLHSQLVNWRYQLAVMHGMSSSGGGIPPHAERFRTLITDDTPNIDPVGSSVGFWHNGYKWDESLGRYAGGKETPASRLVAEVGEWVTARFDEEGNPGDILQNQVILPDGRQVNGNSILRGEAAHKQNRLGIERAKAKGVDTSKFEVNGDFIYIKTATEANRLTIRQALYDYLVQIEVAHQHGETITVPQWAEVAYLLYQSPLNKKGSDAVIRVYLMTLASRWLQPLPIMSDDIDWQAYTKGQGHFVDELVALNVNTVHMATLKE